MEENDDDEDEDDDDDQDTNNNFVDELLQGLPGMDENDIKEIDNMEDLLDAVDDNEHPEDTKSGIMIEHRTAKQDLSSMLEVSTTTASKRRGPWGDHIGRDSESEEDDAPIKPRSRKKQMTPKEREAASLFGGLGGASSPKPKRRTRKIKTAGGGSAKPKPKSKAKGRKKRDVFRRSDAKK